LGYFGLLFSVIIGFVIVVITLCFTFTLVSAYFGKNMLSLELGITLYLIGYFNYFFPIFGFIIIIIKVEMVAKLFG